MKNFLRWIARTTLAGVALAGLASCGGGGVSSDTGNSQGTFAINPGSGSLYAEIPVSFQVVGGQKPYTITSNEQTVIPLVGFRVDGNSFSIIPRNPGVIDAGLQPEEVPRRTVILTVRDNRGVQITAEYRVIQNFLNGYDVSLFALNNCNTDTDPPLSACAGFRSRLSLLPINNGLLHRNRQMRISRVSGDFSMVVNENTGALGQFVDTVTDEQGRAAVQLSVPASAITQFATIRVTDIQSGIYRDHHFTIFSTLGPLSVLPDEITLTGLDNQTCGSGMVTLLASGGTPPYTATSSSPQFVNVSPAQVNESGGTFTVTIGQALPPGCLQDAVVVVRDATGRTDTFTINTEVGSDPPVVPLSVSPTTVCIEDGGFATIAVIGGRPGKVMNSSNPSLATTTPTTGSGDFTFTIDAVGAAPALGTFVTIFVNDGTPNSAQIAARRVPVGGC
jgi:hypothetical protein